MKSNAKLTFGRTLGLAVAGALMLALAACDRQPEAGNPDKGFDSVVENAIRDREPAPATTPGPQGMNQAGDSAPDSVLEARVKAALAADSGLRSVTVDVKSADGVVTLYGTADTPATSYRAAMVALNVDGVRSVKNEMVVVRGS
jgi:hypothetical protein